MAEITLTRPAVYETEGVRLMPGANKITSAQLEALMRNSGVRDDINSGVLIVSHEAKKPAKAEPIEAKAEKKGDK